MNKTGRLILTVFFMALMFIVGIGTFLNAKADIRKVVSEKAVTEIPDAVESVLQEDFKGKNKWINLNGLAQKVLLKTVIKDPGYTVYRLKNGQVMYGLDKRNMKWYAEKLSEFQSWLKKRTLIFCTCRYHSRSKMTVICRSAHMPMEIRTPTSLSAC